MLRRFVKSQRWLSLRFDELLPVSYYIDGNRDFGDSLVPKYLRQDCTVIDVGGGKSPYLGRSQKASLNATVIGVDIDADELARAPDGVYDKTISSDVARYRGNHEADIVICRALLEHVRDVESAFAGIASMLKPGGLALLFVPSRNAVFARLNILLPQKLKKWLLHSIFPKTKRNQGFPSFYDRCTPAEFKRMAESNNLELVEARYYYVSSYFSFFFPFYLIWRLWVIVFRAIRKEQAAETFAMVFRASEN
jgi:SAM-dependent methyltransferase